MRVCVLVSDFTGSDMVKSYPRNPAAYDEGHMYEMVPLKKSIAVKQVMDLVNSKRYDVYLNLCEGSREDDVAGAEVVDTLHRLNAVYTGATPTFYNLSKQAMKIVAHSCGFDIPNHVFIYDTQELDAFVTKSHHLTMPLMVKHYNGHDCVGMTRSCRVTGVEDLRREAERILHEFGGVLIEEFIEGPEFTVLVVADAENPEYPKALTPAQFILPAGETFRHVDLKWRMFESVSWAPVENPELTERLKKASADIFLGCNGTSYARCDFRLQTSTGKIFFLEVNCKCSVFYNPDDWGSADFILSMDPLGHNGFLKSILRAAVTDQKKRRKRLRPFFTPEKGFSIVATEDIAEGGLVQVNEEQPVHLVSRQHVEKTWCPMKVGWFNAYAWPNTDHVFCTWPEDANNCQPINHSCDPNAWLDGLNLVARRPIKKGDEITADYCTFITSNVTTNEFQCNCGAATCRKVINYSDYKEKWFQKHYEGHVSDYVRHQIVMFNKSTKHDEHVTNGYL